MAVLIDILEFGSTVIDGVQRLFGQGKERGDPKPSAPVPPTEPPRIGPARQPTQVAAPPLTEEDVRAIVRDEIRRLQAAKRTAGQDPARQRTG